jgi:hypothetical protein
MGEKDVLVNSIYRGNITIGTSYTADWRVTSRVIELSSPTDSLLLSVENGPETEIYGLLYLEIILLGPGGGEVIGRCRLWSDCFYEMSGKGCFHEKVSSSTSSSSSSSTTPQSQATQRKKKNPPRPPPTKPPSSSSTLSPIPSSSKRYLLKATDIAPTGIHKIQIRLLKPKNFFSFFRRSETLEFTLRLEHIHLHGSSRTMDLNNTFSEPIWSFLEPFQKSPLSELSLPIPPSKGRIFRKPLVLLLGGHSSGKSSFINMILKDKVL